MERLKNKEQKVEKVPSIKESGYCWCLRFLEWCFLRSLCSELWKNEKGIVQFALVIAKLIANIFEHLMMNKLPKICQINIWLFAKNIRYFVIDYED